MIETIDDSPKLSFGGLARLGWVALGVLAAGVVGALAGWFEGLFGTWPMMLFYIYLMVLIGLCVGIIYIALSKARLRYKVVSLLAALLIMVAFLACYEVPIYLNFRARIREEVRISLVNDGIDPNSVDMEAAVDYLIYDYTGLPGIIGYERLRASETQMDYFVRIAVGLAVAVLAWAKFFNRPYCARCQDYYGDLLVAGWLPVDDFDRLRALVESGSLHSAGQMLRESVEGYPKVMVCVQVCPKPMEHETVLSAERVEYSVHQNKVRRKKLLRTRIPGAQYANFLNGAAQAIVEARAAELVKLEESLAKTEAGE